MVERFLVGWSAREVDGLLRRLIESEEQLAAHGVRHIESIVIPGDEMCLSLFDGPDLDAVRSANVELALPTDRVLVATTQGGRA